MLSYRWAVDRFSVTDLQQWGIASLHAEYRWVTASETPPCAAELMADRRVPESALAAEIARRTASPEESFLDKLPGVRTTIAMRMQRQAISLLSDLRWEEAVALFEFALAEDPNDPNASNNLGFCLLPLDPSKAEKHLAQAARLEYEPAVVNAHNRAVCALLLGDPARALELATEHWVDPSDGRPEIATLWRRQAGELSLVGPLDARQELAYVAREASTSLGDDTRAELWQQRCDAGPSTQP